MKEKVLDNKKNGMSMMLLFILLYCAATAATIISAIYQCIPVMVIGIVWGSNDTGSGNCNGKYGIC